MQPSSKCALSKACCCSWGNLREGLVVLSCRRRPPSSLIIPTTPTSAPAPARPSHPLLLAWPLVWQVLSGTSGATRGPHYGKTGRRG